MFLFFSEKSGDSVFRVVVMLGYNPSIGDALASDREIHYSVEATFYSTAVSIVCTVLCDLPSESSLLTVMNLMI